MGDMNVPLPWKVSAAVSRVGKFWPGDRHIIEIRVHPRLRSMFEATTEGVPLPPGVSLRYMPHLVSDLEVDVTTPLRPASEQSLYARTFLLSLEGTCVETPCMLTKEAVAAWKASVIRNMLLKNTGDHALADEGASMYLMWVGVRISA